MNDTLVIYAANRSERFHYIVDWLFAEQLKISYTITDNEAEVTTLPFFISYGKSFPNAFVIPDAGLLWQNSVSEIAIKNGKWNELQVLFAAQGSIPFDILSAAFFLLARYEEYYDYTPDKHGRYPAEASVLYKLGLLERPILDEWVNAFRNLLREQTGLTIPEPKFSYQPTYDIDIAYSYKGKGLIRTAANIVKDIAVGKWKQFSERMAVLSSPTKDPYNSYSWIQKLHAQNSITPLYFILAALETTAFDKNISPLHPEMQKLIQRLHQEGKIGLHPSYYSNKENIFSKEKNTLEKITGSAITISRQHYIKNILPSVPEQLIAHKITEDYSMGYGTDIGFRAGTGQSFLWYNLKEEQITGLRVYPFCFMDTAAKFHMGLGAEAAFQRLRQMAEALKNTGSSVITIFHNSSLGNSSEWKGWKEAYASFIKDYL